MSMRMQDADMEIKHVQNRKIRKPNKELFFDENVAKKKDCNTFGRGTYEQVESLLSKSVGFQQMSSIQCIYIQLQRYDQKKGAD